MTRIILGLLACAVLIIAGLVWPDDLQADGRSGNGSSLVIGVTHSLNSKAMGLQRAINVVLPGSYKAQSNRRYPVIYLIDGGVEQDLIHIAGVVRLGALWGRSGEAIVVGIETKDRRKELTGPSHDPELVKRYPTAGSSTKFREFIRAEVKPLIEATYRTNGRNVVLGESLAGLFIVETYLVEPTLFDSYAAVDPSLWWDKERLTKSAASKLGRRQRGRALLVAIAKEQSEQPNAYQSLIANLGRAKLPICVVMRADQTHATIYQQVSAPVMQYLLPPAEPPPAEYGFISACS
jgi:predicted alpha/beta superfamily hydrolase